MAENGNKIARILVALDSDTPNRTTIEAAVRLAEEFHAELVGLFVTEDNVLKLASLPTARHLIGHTLTAQTLEPGTMERAFRVLADRARADLAAAADPRHVKWSFRTVSGRSEEVVVTEAAGFDVVAFGRTRYRRSVSRASQTHYGVFVTTTETRTGRPIVLWSEGAHAPVELAMRLAYQAGVKLLVLVPSNLDEASVTQLAQRIAAADIRGEIRRRAADTPGAAYRALRGARPGLLVINRTSPLTQDQDFESFIDSLDCAVFLAA
jgi:nucleotide-binding universal stress UspA family protein